MKTLSWLLDRPLTVALAIISALLLYLLIYHPPTCSYEVQREFISPVPSKSI